MRNWKAMESTAPADERTNLSLTYLVLFHNISALAGRNQNPHCIVRKNGRENRGGGARMNERLEKGQGEAFRETHEVHDSAVRPARSAALVKDRDFTENAIFPGRARQFDTGSMHLREDDPAAQLGVAPDSPASLLEPMENWRS